MDYIKLISLNIEGNFHLNNVINFLKAESPDIACLQEVYKKDVPFLENEANMTGNFFPLVEMKYKENSYLPPNGLFGLLVLTKGKPQNISSQYYAGNENSIPVYKKNDPNSLNRALIIATIKRGEAEFTAITTHFTWSDDGQTIPAQITDLEKMLKLLKPIGEFILCGDFNAPRGRKIYSRLSTLYTDNIPKNIDTTLDPELHRVKNLKYVVDGLFTTPRYKVNNVRTVGGISDHKAIVAEIRKI